MNAKQPVIETSRLMLRELLPDDLDFAAEMLADPEVMQFWPRPFDRAEAAEWIERHRRRYLDDGFGYWLGLRKADRKPIGQFGLLRQEFDGKVEVGLGYMLHRPFWGQGYAFEGANGCLDYGFRELGLARIVVLIRPENESSLRLATKLGAERIASTEYSGFGHEVFEVLADADR